MLPTPSPETQYGLAFSMLDCVRTTDHGKDPKEILSNVIFRHLDEDMADNNPCFAAIIDYIIDWKDV